MRPREPWPLRAGSGSQGRRRLLPQVRPRSSGPSLTNTCMSGASWILSCRPRLVWAMMKKVEGLKSVTLAVDTGDKASVGCEGRDPPAAGGGSGPTPSPAETGIWVKIWFTNTSPLALTVMTWE